MYLESKSESVSKEFKCDHSTLLSLENSSILQHTNGLGEGIITSMSHCSKGEKLKKKAVSSANKLFLLKTTIVDQHKQDLFLFFTVTPAQITSPFSRAPSLLCTAPNYARR